MRARQVICHVVLPIIALGWVEPTSSFGQATPPPSKKVVAAPASLPPLPAEAKGPAAATPADAKRAELSAKVRLKELDAPEVKDRPGTKAIRDVLGARLKLLGEWDQAIKDREKAEHPEVVPEKEEAEIRAEQEKVKTLLDQSGKAPDALLPGSFQAASVSGKAMEARLAEMKEAIDAAREDLKAKSDELEKIRTEGTRSIASEIAALRIARDKAFQACAAQAARRGEREAAVQAANAPEARELAREKLANDDWEARIEATRLAEKEALIALTARRVDLGSSRAQLKAARVQLDRRLLGRMEDRYAVLAERERVEIQAAVALEKTRAAQANDPLERYRAKRSAELLELEAQVIAYEKAGATTSRGLSLADQTALADRSESDFAKLKTLLTDGNVSPLDVLRLKNDFRRIVPERALVIRTDLALSSEESTAYENALTDAEIDLVNDSRDDRFEREALLEQLPRRRRAEATTILDDLEARHRTLLNRRRDVLSKLARTAEEIHDVVNRRITTLDQHYAFIRTHIFWIRDAEPLGPATFAHARDDILRAAKGLARLVLEFGDRSLWGKSSAEFLLIVAALVLLPLPLHLARRAMDRSRLAVEPDSGLSLADFPVSPGMSMADFKDLISE